jgi:hypothetical protein
VSAIQAFTRSLPIVFLVSGQLLASSVWLAWTANTETDLAGYWVYRTQTPGINYVRLNTSVITSPSFVDTTAVAGTTYYYAVSATNTSGLESSKTAEVQAVIPAPATNHPPTANAGPDQTAAPATLVNLTGSGTDPDGDVLTYSWSQIGGPAVGLSGASTSTASFTAPSVAADTTLVFRLAVNDGRGGTASDDANVAIVTRFTSPTDFTIGGYVGVGTDSPQRALHVVGPNAVFRMDRRADTAAFVLVRSDNLGNPLKSFVVGANASGANQGEFIINDIGAAVAGGGQRRMTITNTGDTIFTGSLTANSLFPASSLALKTNIRLLEDPIRKLRDLTGVRFSWKSSGLPSLGVIAENVARVLPEAVSREPGAGLVQGVNYSSVTALLLESSKAQRRQIELLRAKREHLKRMLEDLARSNRRLEERVKQ